MDPYSPSLGLGSNISASALNLTSGLGTAKLALAPDIDAEECRLLGPFALVVQGLMGILVLGSLLLKRAKEKPQRPWRIWILDVSKQVLGQAFLHSTNVLISSSIAHNPHPHQGRPSDPSPLDHAGSSPCALYFLNILIDTTLGVFIIFAFLRLFEWVLVDKLGWVGFKSGDYSVTVDHEKRGRSGGGGDIRIEESVGTTAIHTRSPSSSTVGPNQSTESLSLPASQPEPEPETKVSLVPWLKQLVIYLLALTIMKIIVVLILRNSDTVLGWGDWLLGWLGDNKDLQVLVSMMIFPLIMNVLQFLLIDQIIKAKNLSSSLHLSSSRKDEEGGGEDPANRGGDRDPESRRRFLDDHDGLAREDGEEGGDEQEQAELGLPASRSGATRNWGGGGGDHGKQHSYPPQPSSASSSPPQYLPATLSSSSSSSASSSSRVKVSSSYGTSRSPDSSLHDSSGWDEKVVGGGGGSQRVGESAHEVLGLLKGGDGEEERHRVEVIEDDGWGNEVDWEEFGDDHGAETGTAAMNGGADSWDKKGRGAGGIVGAPATSMAMLELKVR